MDLLKLRNPQRTHAFLDYMPYALSNDKSRFFILKKGRQSWKRILHLMFCKTFSAITTCFFCCSRRAVYLLCQTRNCGLHIRAVRCCPIYVHCNRNFDSLRGVNRIHRFYSCTSVLPISQREDMRAFSRLPAVEGEREFCKNSS